MLGPKICLWGKFQMPTLNARREMKQRQKTTGRLKVKVVHSKIDSRNFSYLIFFEIVPMARMARTLSTEFMLYIRPPRRRELGFCVQGVWRSSRAGKMEQQALIEPGMNTQTASGIRTVKNYISLILFHGSPYIVSIKTEFFPFYHYLVFNVKVSKFKSSHFWYHTKLILS